MFSTKTLNSFKGIFPSIHQQLPLSKRESQQLLETLTTSFRKHLDKEHGWTPDDIAITSNLNPTLTYLPQPPIASKAAVAPTTRSSKDALRRPTDRHLRAILANPLFSYSVPLAPASIERAPTDLFDEAVARGLMTIKRAHGFLLSVRRDIQQSTSSSISEGMASCGAGLRVVQWLKASGMERDLSFVSNVRFTNVLIQFLVAEGLEEVVWNWMARLLRGHVSSTEEQPKHAAGVVLQSVVTAKSHTVELDAAFASMLRGEDLVKENSSPMVNLLQAWQRLAWKTTVESWKHSNPPEGLYNSFVEISNHLAPPMRLERAHLNLHHPSHPDATLAVKYLSDEKWARHLPKADANSEGSSIASRQLLNFTTKLMSMGLDTVQHLGRIGEHQEAMRILHILKMRLSGYFDDDAIPMRRLAGV